MKTRRCSHLNYQINIHKNRAVRFLWKYRPDLIHGIKTPSEFTFEGVAWRSWDAPVISDTLEHVYKRPIYAYANHKFWVHSQGRVSHEIPILATAASISSLWFG